MSTHAALATGAVALCLLRATRFRVEACFARSFYLRPMLTQAPPASPQALPAPSLLCCGQDSLAPGPLMVLCATWPEEKDLPLQGSMVERRGQALFWAGGSIAFGQTRPWATGFATRHRHALHVTPADMCVRVAAVLESGAVPQEGLAVLLCKRGEGERDVHVSCEHAPPDSYGRHDLNGPLLARSRKGLKALRSWLQQEGEDKAQVAIAVASLLGLGPGLTPSGDDALAGCLLALHALGRTHNVEVLSQCVAQSLCHTNSISAAHLQAAMLGQGAAPLHMLLHVVLHLPLRTLTQQCASARCHLTQRLGRMGHSSGWDAATGLLTTLAACTESGTEGANTRFHG